LSPIRYLVLLCLLTGTAFIITLDGNSLFGQTNSSFRYNVSSIPQLINEVKDSVVSVESFERSGDTPVSGSGIVYDNEGHIVTNNHLVENGTRYFIIFPDLSAVEAIKVGNDSESDLAVLRVDTSVLPPDKIKPASLGNSSMVNVGEQVLAIGNPLGFSNTVTYGIISQVNRTLPVNNDLQFSIPNVIQLDAEINQGNSGGPLLNLNGDVVGVNSATKTSSVSLGGSQQQVEIPVSGLSFAIPSNVVQKVVSSIVDDGEYEHPYLGIIGATLTPAIRLLNGIDDEINGYLVSGVAAGSPAESREIQPSDIVTSVDGIPVKSAEDFTSIMESKSIGDSVKLGIKRGELNTVIAVELGERAQDSG
jgi:S1-C subfamily serine protease